MCSGRVDPQFVLEAFAKGADGVLIGGCHIGDCHYVEGNYKAVRRVRMLRRVLLGMGIEADRFRLEWISASEGEKVKLVITTWWTRCARSALSVCPSASKHGTRSWSR